MKFSILRQPLVLSVFLMVVGGCGSGHENDRVRDLMEKNLALGPRTDHTLLGIKFGDSPIAYQRKMDSLYKEGIIYSLIQDSLLDSNQDLSYYQYYYLFDDYEALKEIKWIFSPVFKESRLVEMTLITTSVLDKSLADRPFNISKGILKNIIDTSEEVMVDADITYRITKEYFRELYGTPALVSEGRDQSYWFKGNRMISITNTLTTIRILFKDSESE